ncbi:MAG: hypothetical protein JO126_05165 [Alphaproteobacteria bacterium]|nr:hypothetical protein [Alphaproteobacteria bacterium]MBV8548827.1 hypothetical protein [Alphaproteobacteria bacterium]
MSADNTEHQEDMTAEETREQRLVERVRNALLVAGQELGAEGDHWPAIKSTIQQLARDYEDVKIERNVDAELQLHLAEQINLIEKAIAGLPDEAKVEINKDIKELREIYDAYFSPVPQNVIEEVAADEEAPLHVRRAAAILSTLEEPND